MLEGHTEAVRALTLCGTDKVISGSDDTTVRAWDLNTCKCLNIMYGHADNVSPIDNVLALRWSLLLHFSTISRQQYTSSCWFINLRRRKGFLENVSFDNKRVDKHFQTVSSPR